MDSNTFALRPAPSRDRIYISWAEQWDLVRYVDHYLAERQLAVTEELRTAVKRRIAKFPGEGAYRKADMDYYLDANACEFIDRRPPRD
jgi:hypothetical protein